jgi:hypothetical protein
MGGKCGTLKESGVQQLKDDKNSFLHLNIFSKKERANIRGNRNIKGCGAIQISTRSSIKDRIAQRVVRVIASSTPRKDSAQASESLTILQVRAWVRFGLQTWNLRPASLEHLNDKRFREDISREISNHSRFARDVTDL